MHNLDASLNEIPNEAEYEFEGALQEQEGELDEADELELASELMGVSGEAELDQFLGSFIKRIGKKVGKAVNAATGNQLGGLLKPLAKKLLPLGVSALGGALGGPAGAFVAGKLGGVASRALGLELEGMSEEDQELEVARRFVRLANHATRRALRGGPRSVRPAVGAAMRRFAPGLAAYGGSGVGNYGTGRPVHVHHHCTCGANGAGAEPAAADAPAPAADAAPAASEFEGDFEGEYEEPGEYEEEQQELGQSGRWYRRGGRIILVGA